jgi:hypothetical protein
MEAAGRGWIGLARILTFECIVQSVAGKIGLFTLMVSGRHFAAGREKSTANGNPKSTEPTVEKPMSETRGPVAPRN